MFNWEKLIKWIFPAPPKNEISSKEMISERDYWKARCKILEKMLSNVENKVEQMLKDAYRGKNGR